MALRLAIENETNLPDGGPVTFTIAGKRTVDIGRDQHLDWTLPDPSRFISGKHCEVRYKDGGYWLHDVSTNGTYLNGAEERMRAPHRLKSGDRFIVGQYIIAAALDADAFESGALASAGPASANPSASYRELWDDGGAAAPPIDPKHLRAPSEVARPANAEFLDWAASVPQAEPVSPSAPGHFLRPTPGPSAPAADTWALDAAPIHDDMRPSAAFSPSLQIPPHSAPPQSPTSQISPAAIPPRPAASRDAPAERAVWDNQSEPAAAAETSPFLSPPRAEPAPRAPVAQAGPVAAPPLHPAADSHVTDDVFLRTFSAAAGLPADIFAGADRREVAQQLGMALRSAIEGVMQLLKARNQAKQITRSTSQTTIEAIGNNPLKFSPTPEDALRIMFGGKSRSYLDAQATLAQTFDDLKSHQLKTYAALQHAVSRLVAELDPAIIMRDFDKSKRGSLLSSKKASLWDDYRARWDAHMLPQSGGPIAAFMLHFADYYDDAGNSGT